MTPAIAMWFPTYCEDLSELILIESLNEMIENASAMGPKPELYGRLTRRETRLSFGNLWQESRRSPALHGLANAAAPVHLSLSLSLP